MRLGKFFLSFEKSAFFKKLEARLWRVTRYDLTLFMSQLEVLYNAGIPVMRALKLLIEQASNRKLARILERVRSDIGRGRTFSAGMAQFPEVFNSIEVSVIRVGEAVGDLGKVLRQLADFQRRELNLIKRVQAAMIYPLVVFCCALSLIIFLSQFLFKTILPVITAQGVDLNTATRVLVFLVTFFQHPVVMFCFVLLLGGILFFAGDFLKSPSFIEFKDRNIWKLPLFGQTIKKITLARFCYNMSLMNDSGIGLLRSLAIVADSSENTLMQKALYQSIELLKEGEPFWKSLKHPGIFPASLLSIVKVGEASGTLSMCLKKLADFYEMEVTYSVENVAASLEPIMISGMGVFVGVIIFITLSPLYKLIESFGF